MRTKKNIERVLTGHYGDPSKFAPFTKWKVIDDDSIGLVKRVGDNIFKEMDGWIEDRRRFPEAMLKRYDSLKEKWCNR